MADVVESDAVGLRPDEQVLFAIQPETEPRLFRQRFSFVHLHQHEQSNASVLSESVMSRSERLSITVTDAPIAASPSADVEAEKVKFAFMSQREAAARRKPSSVIGIANTLLHPDCLPRTS